ncbi:Anaphase-promoting complex, cyclosome, subunit 3 [Pseudoalteromonas sp. P1-9]|uniref:tetratricopeptide repeat protein n=1 Tax=Pseudoalteromonas sp. P1-9 TaxID=1710354 RepID=UPI0006D615A1|nr:tetratricopeptide repeat protein [Pseudoalteromonas sp. P1-9]KPV96827.1 Anaphase-promoting complex, cyclosome, subunit 3 [Pseudoalteromonas sp. P1-9]
MSVLNKTLKGLEQRQTEAASSVEREQTVSVTPISDIGEKLHKLAIPVLAVVALSLVAYVVYKKDLVQHFFVKSPNAAESIPVTASNEKLAVSAPTSEMPNRMPEHANEQANQQQNEQVTEQSKSLTSQSSPQAEQVSQSVEVSNDTTATQAPRVASQKVVPAVEEASPVQLVERKKAQPTERQATMKQVTKITATQQANEYFQAGKKAFTFGLVSEAIAALEQCIAVLNEHIECRSLLAAAFYGRQDTVKASNVLEQGLSLKPDSMEWRTLLARIYADNKQYNEVLSVLPQRYESQGDNDFWILKGLAAQQLKQHEVALRSFKKLTLSQPEQGKWWLAMARSAEFLKQWQNAMQYYTTATQIGNLSPASQRYAVERLQFIRGRLDAS